MNSARLRKVTTSAAGVAAVVIGAIGISGCGDAGPQRTAVHGAVWVDGKPLESGSIRFVPTDGTKGPEAAAQIENGFYELPIQEGPVVGTVRVEIRDIVDPGFDLDDPEQFTEHGKDRLPGPKIPPEYNVRSRIVRTVSADETNKLDFEIELPAKRRTRR